MNPTEQQEGEKLAQYLRMRGFYFTHIPNETGHSPEAIRRAIRMKRQGTSPGFPDYIIVLDKAVIAIELKRKKGGVLSINQKEWIERLNKAGICSKVCRGFDEAVNFIKENTK